MNLNNFNPRILFLSLDKYTPRYLSLAIYSPRYLSLACVANARYFSIVRDINTTSQPINLHNNVSSNFVSRLLNSFNDPKNVLINDERSQSIIENIIFDEYESVFSGNTKKYIVGGINTELLNPILSKYVFDNEYIMNKYIDNLFKEQTEILNNIKNINKLDVILIATIITSFDKSSIRNFCLRYFLLVYTF